jgi:imidazolonepropionase-like amidohydrolase
MVQIGVCVNNLAALRAITIQAAKLLEVDNELGSLDIGKTADVVVVGGNPVADLENVRRVEKVFVRGRLAYAAGGGYAQAW